MLKLLIPSAKIVNEELQAVGKLPAIIYPVNGHTVFSYLYKQYQGFCNIEILCFENATLIRKKLSIYSGIEFNDIPELNDLGHTVYYGLLGCDMPIIINFGDTIVADNIYENKADSFYYSEDYISDKWTYFDISNGQLTNIYDKEIRKVSNYKNKLFVGVFYLSNPQDFKKCLERSFDDRSENISSFYDALREYSKIHPLEAIKTDNWFDIGHADKYEDSILEVRTREFNHIRVDRDRGILIKTSEQKGKLVNEIEWYLKLPSDIEYIRPRIFSYSLNYKNPSVSMEYYAYHTVHELYLNGDLTILQWKNIFGRIKFIYNDMQRYRMKDVKIKKSLKEMYETKTFQRLNQLRADSRFEYYFAHPFFVNNIRYLSIDCIIEKLKIAIPEMLFDECEFNIIHGDLCFANMMIDGNLSFIKLIDPRGKFGQFDIYGDHRYELAKLFHCVDGKYDYIIKDLFFLDYSDDKINFKIAEDTRDFDLYKVFISVFEHEIGNDLKKIELIESLLFLSMIPLHSESYEQQLVMLGMGVSILNRIVDIRME